MWKCVGKYPSGYICVSRDIYVCPHSYIYVYTPHIYMAQKCCFAPPPNETTISASVGLVFSPLAQAQSSPFMCRAKVKRGSAAAGPSATGGTSTRSVERKVHFETSPKEGRRGKLPQVDAVKKKWGAVGSSLKPCASATHELLGAGLVKLRKELAVQVQIERSLRGVAAIARTR